MSVLITGATGMLGRELVHELAAKGETVKILARDTRRAKELFSGLEILRGDITESNLGLLNNPHIEAVYHLAALLNLGGRHKDELWDINVVGTQNVIKFMKLYDIPYLLFCSTAYTQGRNYYEESKLIAENYIEKSGLKATIFKPSIIVPSSKTFTAEKPQHLYVVIRMLARVHRRMEIVRKAVEGTLRLPPKRISFRIKAAPSATLDMVPADWVARKMASVQDGREYMLTSQRPVPIAKLMNWIGEVLFLNLEPETDFRMTPVEALFDRLAKPFLVYVEDSPKFKPSFNDSPIISRKFIERTVVSCLDCFPQ